MENPPKWWILFGFCLNCNTIINDDVQFTHKSTNIFRWFLRSNEQNHTEKDKYLTKLLEIRWKRNHVHAYIIRVNVNILSDYCCVFSIMMTFEKLFSEIDCLERLMACNQRNSNGHNLKSKRKTWKNVYQRDIAASKHYEKPNQITLKVLFYADTNIVT